MSDITEKTQWHPAFYDAVKAELDEYRHILRFIPERPLTAEPLRMDLLVIKKLEDIVINKNIGRVFKRDNILEYKAPGDSLAVSDYNKVFGYAYIYAYLEKLDIRDTTLTFVASAHPYGVFSYLRERAEISVEEASSGIYYVRNEIMPVQIISTKRLPEDENIWLTSLTEQLRGEQFERVVRERGKLSTDINALLYALIIANPEVLEEEAVKMGASLEVVLDRLGYIDKRTLEKSENERAKAEEAMARAEEEKSLLLAEHARFMKSQREAAVDMLRHGMPVTTICKWTELSEDEIRGLKPPVIEKQEETSM